MQSFQRRIGLHLRVFAETYAIGQYFFDRRACPRQRRLAGVHQCHPMAGRSKRMCDADPHQPGAHYRDLVMIGHLRISL